MGDYGMKAFEIRDGFGIERLTVVDKPEPVPGPGQALIKMRALSLNYRDLMVVTGTYNPRMKLPRVPFSDGAGEVAAVGPGVTRVKPGDRVMAAFMQKWIDGEPDLEKARSALGGAIDGLLAEYVALDQEGLVHIPEHLSFEEASTLPCAAVTAWHALIVEGRIKPGDVVLTQGTGGVSIFAVQFAHMAGARVIVTSSSNQKIERARKLGASEGINYKENADWDKKAIELTGGTGVDHIVELGGAGTINKSLRAVRLGGRISVIGALAGFAGDVSTGSILMKNVRLQGIFVGSRAMFEDMNRAISRHKLQPFVDRVFRFDETREALRQMETASHFGKICVIV
jgi:NADPH:quinone reductase-like Zn-dependent oxidoreductase